MARIEKAGAGGFGASRLKARRRCQRRVEFPRDGVELVLRRGSCRWGYHSLEFQTCLLHHAFRRQVLERASALDPSQLEIAKSEFQRCLQGFSGQPGSARSEERRVGQEWSYR